MNPRQDSEIIMSFFFALVLAWVTVRASGTGEPGGPGAQAPLPGGAPILLQLPR